MSGINKKLFIVAISVAIIMAGLIGGWAAAGITSVAAPSVIAGLIFLAVGFVSGLVSFCFVLGTVSFAVGIYKSLAENEEFDIDWLIENDELMGPVVFCTLISWGLILCWLIGSFFALIFT
jgi:hypothetical protein